MIGFILGKIPSFLTVRAKIIDARVTDVRMVSLIVNAGLQGRLHPVYQKDPERAWLHDPRYDWVSGNHIALAQLTSRPSYCFGGE